jgi:Alpha-acetolactate decarboxylase
MPTVTIEIPTSLKIALDTEIAHVGGDESGVITTALAAHLGTPVHTLFQISTSGAPVAGVYARAVSVRTILDHGDFGLGTLPISMEKWSLSTGASTRFKAAVACRRLPPMPGLHSHPRAHSPDGSPARRPHQRRNDLHGHGDGRRLSPDWSRPQAARGLELKIQNA